MSTCWFAMLQDLLRVPCQFLFLLATALPQVHGHLGVFYFSFNCLLTLTSALEEAKKSHVNKPAESHQRLEMLQSANLILQK